MRVGFCVSGHGQLFRAAVTNQRLLGIDPRLLILDQSASKGLEAFASAHEIPFIRLSRTVRKEFERSLTHACLNAELTLIALTFDRLIPASLIDSFTGTIINVHMSLLPAFTGFEAISRAIGANVRFAGATIHLVDESIDEGPILAQVVLPTYPDDTPEILGARIFPYIRLQFLQVLAWFAQGRVERSHDNRYQIRDAHYGAFPCSPTIEIAMDIT